MTFITAILGETTNLIRQNILSNSTTQCRSKLGLKIMDHTTRRLPFLYSCYKVHYGAIMCALQFSAEVGHMTYKCKVCKSCKTYRERHTNIPNRF